MGLSKAYEALATKLNHTKISIHVNCRHKKGRM